MEAERRLCLEKIAIDPALQPRVTGLDPAHVQVLQETPGTWPPLTVVQRDGQYIVIDGSHRFEAARQLGLTEIACEVRPEPRDGDLKALAFELNRDHGKPLTLADRKAEAERLLHASPTLSNRAISDRCGLSDKTVGTIRTDLEETAEIPQSTSRVGADGKIRSVASISKRNDATTGPEGLGHRKGRSSGRPSATVRPNPSFGALLNILDEMQRYAAAHATDGLAEAVVMAVHEHRPSSAWSEITDVMEVWQDALAHASDALRQHAAA